MSANDTATDNTGDATMTGPARPELIEVDPRLLVVHPNNVRRVLELDEEFVDSIRQQGVLEPVHVAPMGDDSYMVVLGHRRRAGAIEAAQPTILALSHPDWVGLEPDAIARQIVENKHRQGILPTEEAAAYTQLAADFGWDDKTIAEATGTKPEYVKGARALHQLPAKARKAADTGALTFDEALRVEEFINDKKATKRLMDAAANGRIHYALAEERRRRDKADRSAAALAELRAANVKVVKRPPQFGWGSKEVRLGHLTDPDGNEYTVQTHAACPGHAAFVDDGDAVYVCREPKTYGHKVVGTVHPYEHLSPEEAAEREAEEAAERAYAEALATAADARRDWLRDQLAASPKPKTAKDYTRTALTLFHRHADTSLPHQWDRWILDVLGIRCPDEADPHDVFTARLNRTGENRLSLFLLAQAAAYAEFNITATGRWNHHPSSTVAWLDFLTLHGYQLSEAETTLRAEAEGSPNTDSEPDEPDVAEPDEPDVAEPDEPDVAEPDEPDVAEPDEPDVAEPVIAA